jgi:hypothetical protein
MSEEDRDVDEVAEVQAEEPAGETANGEPAMDVPVGEEPPAADDFWKAPSETVPADAPLEPEPLQPVRRQTGLIVVIASILLVLIAAVFVGPGLYAALVRTEAPKTAVSVERARITTAIDFVKALLNGQTMDIKVLLPDNVQNAITAEQWAQIASADTTPAVTFSSPAWSGDAKAVVTLSAPDTTGTLTFTTPSADATTVTMAADIGGSTELDTIGMVKAGSGWRIVSLANDLETTVFDAALMKSMVETPVVEPTTTP